MKKYQLGALTVSDKGLQDTKEEIVIELTFGGRTGFFTRKKCSIIFTTGK